MDDHGSDKEEAEIPDFTMQEPIAISVYNSSPSGSGDWHHDFPEPSSYSSTLVLLGLTRAQKGISGPPPLIQFSDLDESESDDGSEVVDRSWETVEIEILTSQPALTIESDASNLGQLACPLRMQQKVFGAVKSGFFISIASRSWQHGWVSNVMRRT